MRHFYETLNNKHKTIYSTLLSGLELQDNNIQVPNVSLGELEMIFHSITMDNPHIFYVHVTQPFIYDASNSVIKPNYIYDRVTIKNYQSDINSLMIFFDSVKLFTDIEKELFLHDYCLNNFTYNWAENPDMESYTIIGLLNKKTAVCQGIALFVKLVFDYVGIQSLVVNGEVSDPVNNKTEKHAWNIVSIEGNFYHLDVTWDMTHKQKHNRYDYFNLCDREIKRDHKVVHEFQKQIPCCIAADKDYYSINNMVATSYIELEDCLLSQLKHDKNVVFVKIKNMITTTDSYRSLKDMLSKIVNGLLEKSIIYKGYNSSENQTQFVFEISFCDTI